ncbi:hypothetical protein BYT27DRAFT_7182955 [Phlegmacium glaucopus]|nr:hypothetical protein BYT27DRAFT_7182955 [Phlegmacium glaucopus]
MTAVTNDISEDPAPLRSKTWSFYVVLFIAVIPLWSSVPLAWIFTAHSLITHSFYNPLFYIALCEVFFSIYYLYLAHHVSGPSPCGPGNPEEIQVAYMRLLKAGLADLSQDGGNVETLITNKPGSPAESINQLDRHDPRAIDFRHCLRTWFCKVPWSSIKLVELQKWLYWAMYNTELPPLESLPDDQWTNLEEALELLQRRLGCKVEEGSNPKIVPMRITIDKTSIIWRPLTYYVLVCSANWALRQLYKAWWDLRHGRSNGIEYLLRVPAKWDPMTSPRPIVFIHGLGLGLIQYHILLSHLFEKFVDRPILVPLQPHVSQNIFHPFFLKPLDRHQMADRLAGLIEELGWATLLSRDKNAKEMGFQGEKVESPLTGNTRRGITMLSHSNGSYTHAWMLKEHPNIITRSCFVDPVTFCSWEGDVCYNFFYRPPTTGIELLMRYFVGSELGVSNLLQRHFCWASNSLWFEEIPNAKDQSKTFFLMGGKDEIVHTERVKRYLTSHGVRKNLWFDPLGRHGQALNRGSPGLKEILRWLSEYEH